MIYINDSAMEYNKTIIRGSDIQSVNIFAIDRGPHGICILTNRNKYEICMSAPSETEKKVHAEEFYDAASSAMRNNYFVIFKTEPEDKAEVRQY